MITYFDTSTLIKLIIEETGSTEASAIWDQASSPVSARITYVEARAALAVAKRGRRITSAQHRVAITDLDMLWTQVAIVEVTSEVVEAAVKLADDHGLLGYDAVHLGSAVIAGAELFTSADRQLCDAALGVGLHVANPIERE